MFAPMINLSDLTENPDNPRSIRDHKYELLKNSLREFPKMMELRPIIVDDSGVILGGNMRYRALRELGYTEVNPEWVKKASALTEDERRRFIITDNVPFGEHDWDMLAEWDRDELAAWGLEPPIAFEGNLNDFFSEHENKEKPEKLCPHCGKAI